MYRYLLFFMLTLAPAALLAEANVPDENAQSTFLLTAPGTLSTPMIEDRPNSADQPPPRFKSNLQPRPLRYPARQFGNGVESYKFPQYGQVKGRNNPWSDEEPRRRLPPLPPANPYFSNPWDLSGQMPVRPQSPGYQPAPYPYCSAGTPGYHAFRNDPFMNPDFPDTIYRDTNPASPPFIDGFFPGANGGNFDFPFAPFNMF